MRQLQTRIEKLELHETVKDTQHLYVRENFCMEIVNPYAEREEDRVKFYKPSLTLSAFHSDNHFVRLIMGPFGSGKSTGLMAEIIFKAIEMPQCNDGVRRSRWVMVRNTYGELQNTTLKTWLTWFGKLGNIRTLSKPPYIHHRFNDGKGPVELEIIFLALDRDDHISKLKSADFTGAYLNEACELPSSVLETITGRVGRYPALLDINHAPFWCGVIADTNPPDTDNYLYRLFEVEKPSNYIIFKQPPGLLDSDEGYITNPEAENIQNLAPNYYLNQANGATKEFINVFCKGQYGILSSGKAVYPEYNDDVHSENNLGPLKGIPLDLSFDFGLTPACLITQFAADGRLVVLQELVSRDMFIETFLSDIVLPTLSLKYSAFDIGSVVGDEAGMAGYKAGVKTCFDYLIQAGFRHARPALSNLLEPRLNAVKYFLNKLPGGKAAIILSRENCPVLRKGFIKGYEYLKQKVLNKDQYREEPNKNEYSHIHDCLQYRAMEYIPQKIKQGKEVDVSYYLKPPAYSGLESGGYYGY